MIGVADTSGCRCDNEKNNNDDEMIQRKVSVKETAAGGMNCVNIESKATQDAVVCVDKEIQCDARRSRGNLLKFLFFFFVGLKLIGKRILLQINIRNEILY